MLRNKLGCFSRVKNVNLSTNRYVGFYYILQGPSWSNFWAYWTNIIFKVRLRVVERHIENQ